MCQVSRVTCHLSPVTIFYLNFYLIFFYKKKKPEKFVKQIEQRGGASWWRVCYQRGLPPLVLLAFGES